jgi:Co/Zn/Cd efflux system component
MHQLSAKSEADDKYTYGWHRAEILAALVNGVFLLALCFSVSLEALERFFSAPGKLKINVYRICADVPNPLQKLPTQNWL